MQLKKEEINSNFRSLSKLFSDIGLVETSKQIDHILRDISENKAPEELHSSWKQLFNIFQIEYTKNDPYRQKIFVVMDKIIGDFIQKTGIPQTQHKYEEIIPIFEDIRSASQNMEAINRVVQRSGNLSEKERYLAICVNYLFNVEGIFGDSIRVLYILKAAVNGKDVSYNDVQAMSLWKLREKPKCLGIPDSLFEGWEGNHLRNSIAHLRFEYNEQTKKMNIKDYYFEKGKRANTYDEDWSLIEFSRFYKKIDDVSDILSYLHLILRIRNLIQEAVSLLYV